MKLHLTLRNVVAFCLFALLMGESHEIAHFIVGKVVCGCWPISRDFNAWEICDCEAGFYATAAGPIFSMTLAWIGMFMLNNPDARKKSFGFVLIWANVPQARIMTVAMGGGDEGVVARELFRGTAAQPYAFWISLVVVLIMALPPIVASLRILTNRYAWLYNVGFMILPLLLLGSYGFLLLNRLLADGFLSDVWIMGTPLFITLHTLLVLVVLLLVFRKELFTLAGKRY